MCYLVPDTICMYPYLYDHVITYYLVFKFSEVHAYYVMHINTIHTYFRLISLKYDIRYILCRFISHIVGYLLSYFDSC